MFTEIDEDSVEYTIVVSEKFAYAFAKVGEDLIDQSNILAITLETMKNCVFKLLLHIYEQKIVQHSVNREKISYHSIKDVPKIQKIVVLVLIDGNKLPSNFDSTVMCDQSEGGKNFAIEALSIVKGDEKIVSVAAASIVAKVNRDGYMRKIAAKYPEFLLDVNKGYGTAEHRKKIVELGPQKIHRLSYEPCYTLLAAGVFQPPKNRVFKTLPKKSINKKLLESIKVKTDS